MALMSPILIYEDAHLLVFNKPAGLLSVPGRLPENKDSLAVRAQAQFADALVVHRLDMATSGVMIMARGHGVHRTLSIAFAERRVHKRYVAVVAGELAKDEGEVDLPLIADWPNRPRQKVDHLLGKPSVTRFWVRERLEDQTRLELEPVTGRSHQLRVHMMALGHPILGDYFYAPPEIEAQSPRLLLHAKSISLMHPITGCEIHFFCESEF
jgi:tRNA pseudouridine32 synthase / 23S rRNA pseudouridine746 synthase